MTGSFTGASSATLGNGLTVSTIGIDILAGGLRVTAGGASISGTSSFNGPITASSNLTGSSATFSGNVTAPTFIGALSGSLGSYTGVQNYSGGAVFSGAVTSFTGGAKFLSAPTTFSSATVFATGSTPTYSGTAIPTNSNDGTLATTKFVRDIGSQLTDPLVADLFSRHRSGLTLGNPIGGGRASFLARRTTSQNILNITYTPVLFDSLMDSQGVSYNAGTGSLTITKSGFYTVSTNIVFTVGGVGTRALQLYLNSNPTDYYSTAVASGSLITSVGISVVIFLQAGNQLEVRCFQDAGASLSLFRAVPHAATFLLLH